MNEPKLAWIRILENLRFDITRRDPLQARKEYDSRRAVNVSLDDSGQMRMTITRQRGETKGEKRQSHAGREYQIFREQNAVTTINYRLRTGDDLAAVLSEMEKEFTEDQ